MRRTTVVTRARAGISRVHGDHGAHGPYEDTAHPRNLQLALAIHRPSALLGVTAAAVSSDCARPSR